MRLLLCLAAAKLVSVSTGGMVRKESGELGGDVANLLQSAFTCTIQDNVAFLGQRGGKFIRTSFAVSKCNMQTCSALRVIGGGSGQPEHISTAFAASRATSQGAADPAGGWCLCREGAAAASNRLLVSFGGVSSAKPCDAATCYEEYVQYVEKFVLAATPGTTALARTEWRRAAAPADADTESYWSTACCEAGAPGCSAPGTGVVPFRNLLKQLQTGDPDITDDRQRELADAEKEQIDLGESDEAALDEDPAALHEQCDGKEFDARPCAGDAVCTFQNQYYSQCLPLPDGDVTVDSEPFGNVDVLDRDPETWRVPLWGQCGGKDWTGPTECVEGVCEPTEDGGEFYSQCRPAGPETPSGGLPKVKTWVDVVTDNLPKDKSSPRAKPPGSADLSEAEAYDLTKEPRTPALTSAPTPSAATLEDEPLTPQRPRQSRTPAETLQNHRPLTPVDPARDARIQGGESPSRAASPVTADVTTVLPAADRPVTHPTSAHSADAHELMFADWQYKWMEPFCTSATGKVLMSWELACMLVFEDREVPGDFELCGDVDKPAPLLRVAPPSQASAHAWTAMDAPTCELRGDTCCGRSGCRPEFFDTCVTFAFPDLGVFHDRDHGHIETGAGAQAVEEWLDEV